ncbi:hypothetical protein M413DRAFT_444427 [Hebeloma cylindrosporum]|uniref:Uncharacterized protein n=1 Tax=Hebeloma cylindrosporum TaxID=76867 RepID=A0A0C3CGL9_HEBCY|nr:hypothetical protein M413DRAFT_444427 [Hebeloma cylindrosporum h7]
MSEKEQAIYFNLCQPHRSGIPSLSLALTLIPSCKRCQVNIGGGIARLQQPRALPCRMYAMCPTTPSP